MILDKNLEFADATSVANAAGVDNIGSTIDMTVVRDIGNGQPVYLVINVDTEIITGGSAGIIQFRLVSDSTEVPSADETPTLHAKSEDFVTDDSAANDSELNAGGYPFVIALPLEGPEYERYLGIQTVITTTTVTAGNINAFLTLDPVGWKAYPDATN
ncbi:hypothetical protein LCGC14_2628420 [marine sediment metagenome]|uniref:Uncharacterized protein n=1 Tax=marine sediment metagenome TaxID=412755 RepID=A0A0F9A163_9ZZZZ